jgi:hypothetical protein
MMLLNHIFAEQIERKIGVLNNTVRVQKSLFVTCLYKFYTKKIPRHLSLNQEPGHSNLGQTCYDSPAVGCVCGGSPCFNPNQCPDEPCPEAMTCFGTDLGCHCAHNPKK